MAGINFCPNCSSQEHKIIEFNSTYFCKSCDAFFKYEKSELKCPKCDSMRIRHSDFPTPSGEVVFQCQSCKKMYPASEFFKKNGARIKSRKS